MLNRFLRLSKRRASELVLRGRFFSVVDSASGIIVEGPGKEAESLEVLMESRVDNRLWLRTEILARDHFSIGAK